MNTYNINDENFKNTEAYRSFMNDNPANGYLKIRAYSASGAVPIVGMKVIVSTIYDNNVIIFKITNITYKSFNKFSIFS